jgi:oligopeptide/dipeptide ABC transporter ATP-binding protein
MTDAALLDVQALRTWFPIRRGVLQRIVGHVRAVDGLSLSIAAGETVALVGESGCGKTTVGRSIVRLLEPQSGTVSYLGMDLLRLPQRELRTLRRNLQMVFQDPATSLDPRMRVREILTEGMQAFGIGEGESERTDRVAESLRRVRLEPEHMKRFPHEFSGGQRQRLGIARALSVQPRLIILDEAVSALDVSIQAQILNLLGELQQQDGLAYLFITHDLSVVRYLASRVYVMYLGQIVEEAQTEALFAAPQHPYTRGLLAAIPSVDPDQRSVEVQVLGDVPSPAQPPPGCRFHTRCPEVFDRCRKEMPEFYSLGDRRARCFLCSPNTARAGS